MQLLGDRDQSIKDGCPRTGERNHSNLMMAYYLTWTRFTIFSNSMK